MHPWTIAAQINHGNALAAAGDPAGALAEFGNALEVALDVLPDGHPYLALLSDNSTGIDPPTTEAPGAAVPQQRLRDVDIEIPAT
jgi:hypothetical protein